MIKLLLHTNLPMLNMVALFLRIANFGYLQMSFFMVYLIKETLMDGVKIYLMELRNLIC